MAALTLQLADSATREAGLTSALERYRGHAEAMSEQVAALHEAFTGEVATLAAEAEAATARVSVLEGLIEHEKARAAAAEEVGAKEREACYAALKEAEEAGRQRTEALASAAVSADERRAAEALCASLAQRADEAELTLAAVRVELDRLRGENARILAKDVHQNVRSANAQITPALEVDGITHAPHAERDLSSSNSSVLDATVASLPVDIVPLLAPPAVLHPFTPNPTRRVVYRVEDGGKGGEHPQSSTHSRCGAVELTPDVRFGCVKVQDGGQTKSFYCHRVYTSHAEFEEQEVGPCVSSLLHGRHALMVLATAPSHGTAPLTNAFAYALRALFNAQGQGLSWTVSVGLVDVDAGGEVARDVVEAAVRAYQPTVLPGTPSPMYLSQAPLLWNAGRQCGVGTDIEVSTPEEGVQVLAMGLEARERGRGAGMLLPTSHAVAVLSVTHISTGTGEGGAPHHARLFMLLPCCPAWVAVASSESMPSDTAAAVQSTSSASASSLQHLQDCLDRLMGRGVGGSREEGAATVASNGLTAIIAEALRPTSSLLYSVHAPLSCGYDGDADAVGFLLRGDDLFRTCQLASHREGSVSTRSTGQGCVTSSVSSTPQRKPAMKRAVAGLPLGSGEAHDPHLSRPEPDLEPGLDVDGDVDAYVERVLARSGRKGGGKAGRVVHTPPSAPPARPSAASRTRRSSNSSAASLGGRSAVSTSTTRSMALSRRMQVEADAARTLASSARVRVQAAREQLVSRSARAATAPVPVHARDVSSSSTRKTKARAETGEAAAPGRVAVAHAAAPVPTPTPPFLALADLDALIADEVALSLRMAREMEVIHAQGAGAGPIGAAVAAPESVVLMGVLSMAPLPLTSHGPAYASVHPHPTSALARYPPLGTAPPTLPSLGGPGLSPMQAVPATWAMSSPGRPSTSPALAGPPSLRLSQTPSSPSYNQGAQDPVPGMRRLLRTAQALLGGRDQRLVPRHLDELRACLVGHDLSGRGSLDDVSFASALRAWVGLALHQASAVDLLAGMGLEGASAIDYLDFADGLESLAIGEGLLGGAN